MVYFKSHAYLQEGEIAHLIESDTFRPLFPTGWAGGNLDLIRPPETQVLVSPVLSKVLYLHVSSRES